MGCKNLSPKSEPEGGIGLPGPWLVHGFCPSHQHRVLNSHPLDMTDISVGQLQVYGWSTAGKTMVLPKEGPLFCGQTLILSLNEPNVLYSILEHITFTERNIARVIVNYSYL